MFPAGDSIRALLHAGESHLVSNQVNNARRNAEWLLCGALDCSVLDLYVNAQDVAETDQATGYWEMIERRVKREPLQHILGSTEFLSLPFEVRPGVFVPRPETETLVEAAVTELRHQSAVDQLAVADLCCGSGIIGVCVAHQVLNARVTSVDINNDAITLTRENASLNGVDERVQTRREDVLQFMREGNEAGERFAAVLCNPPYIESGQMSSLPPEVRDHDPHEALDGGGDGLDFYRSLIPMLPARMTPDGFVMVEIGDTQGNAVSALLARERFSDIKVIQDYTLRDRVVTGFVREGNG
jgi:release factor glutamine methyltransferase